VVHLKEDVFSAALVGLDEISRTNKRVVVDNTPLPKGGAFSEDTLSAMMTVRTDFEMGYNIKTLTMYAGLASIFILWINLGIAYLYCKLKSDTEAKRVKMTREYGESNNDDASEKIE